MENENTNKIECRTPKKVKVVQSCPTVRDLMDCSPWNSPGQNTRVDSLSLLQGDLPNPEIQPRSPSLQADSLPAESQGKPKNTLANFPNPGTEPGSPAFQVDS